MASQVEVMNAAGAAIGATTRITDPDDNRTLARNIRAVWTIQRKAAIRHGAWNFAMKRAKLGATTGEPKHGYAYQYPLPTDCLRLIEVHDLIAYQDFQVEQRAILADVAGPLNVRYLADIEQPELWDALFAEAFAYRIAWAIGTRIAGSTFDKEKVWRQYSDCVAAAKGVDAIESPHQIGDREESDWITARSQSSGWDGRI